jgi:hypothetical protein
LAWGLACRLLGRLLRLRLLSQPLLRLVPPSLLLLLLLPLGLRGLRLC